MKILKKLISISCAFIVSATYLSTFISVAETNQDSFLNVNDGIWVPLDETDILDGDESPLSKLYAKEQLRDLPYMVDNSESIYFPNVGNQGGLNSCAAWATTYYQFTYEVNKYRGITTTTSTTYSPSWTYNYINGGRNTPTLLGDAYDVLKYHGAMKLPDFQYNPNASQYNYNWSTDINKMAEALSYRATAYQNRVTTSGELNYLKWLLAMGKIAVVWTNVNGWGTELTTENEDIIIRGSDTGSNNRLGHFMTIVGYDDNITVNVDGNTTMVGAFKLVDSKSISEHNNGYIWVAYDALNNVSDYQTGWESSYTFTRQPIFNTNNYYTTILINHYKSYLIGKVEYYTTDPWHTNIFGNLYSSINNWDDSKRFTPMYYYYMNMSYNGLSDIPDLIYPYSKVMLFDYFNDTDPSIGNYLSSSFSTKLTNSTSNYTYPISISIIDNLCQYITSVDTSYNTTTLSQYLKTFTLNLAKGRITHYDNNPINSNDVGLLASYLLGNSQLSSLQWYLADMDNDSAVDSIDLALMQQAVGRQNNSENVLDVFIPELNSTIREYILNQNDMDTLTRVEQALAS